MRGVKVQELGKASQPFQLTSILPLVHLGISTTMFKTVCCSFAYRGISWKGEIGTPSFSMYMRCSSVLGWPTFLTLNGEAIFAEAEVGEMSLLLLEKWRTTWFRRGEEILCEDRASVGAEVTNSSCRFRDGKEQIIGLNSRIDACINCVKFISTIRPVEREWDSIETCHF